MGTSDPPLRPRLLALALERALAASPVVILTGARQTGKSTLARMLPSASRRRYLTLDDLDLLGLAEKDPDALLADGADTTLDEVQRAPSLLMAIKRAVDRDRRKGRFLLTGSANLLLLDRVGETLAGRAVHLELGPMTPAELRGTPDPGPWSALLQCADAGAAAASLEGRATHAFDWRGAVVRGGLPPAALEADSGARELWFDGYVRTYLERDLREISSIDGLADFRRLLRVAAARTGALVNQTELARDVALSQPTVHRYLNLLEVSYVLARLPAFSTNRGKRVVHRPKLYWGDAGLAAFLARWSGGNPAAAEDSLTGALLENLVCSSLAAWRETCLPRPEILCWRTASGQEVDFVVESGARLLPLEVKASTRPGAADGRWLGAFLAEHRDRAPFGLILCDTPDVRPVARDVIAVPLGRVL